LTLPGVENIVPIMRPYKLAGLELKKEPTVVDCGGVKIGGKQPIAVIAGPCAVESYEQFIEIAKSVKKSGANLLRGGAFKPRSSPYSFQGLEEEGLRIMKEAKEETGLPLVTEVVDPRDVELVASYVDVLQIGARNMQNFRLLKEVGMQGKPVLLKRGLSATIDEWLMAAEYIMSEGNEQVILCERGIRTFETATRNTLDISAVPVLKEATHLPVVIDPSHASGKAQYVAALSRAAVAAGTDGLIIEVHNDPPNAASDGEQSLRPEQFDELYTQLKKLMQIMGRA
jgi:3-deoxy-7-phosphoheptulonate synthase